MLLPLNGGGAQRKYVGKTKRLGRDEMEIDWEAEWGNPKPPGVGEDLTVYVEVPGDTIFGQRYLSCTGQVEAVEQQARTVWVRMAVGQMRYKRLAKSMGAAGHAVVELALMSPWIFLLFLGVFDFGFYAYAAIATQNAARSAAMVTSTSSTLAGQWDLACLYVLQELRGLPNVGPGTVSCAPTIGGISDAVPVSVQAQGVAGPDTQPASRVTVTYLSPRLFAIPGMMGRMQLTRIVEMRLRE